MKGDIFKVWDRQESKFVKAVWMVTNSGALLAILDKTIMVPAAERYEIVWSTPLVDVDGNSLYEGDVVLQDIQTEYGSFVKSTGTVMLNGGGWMIGHDSLHALMGEFAGLVNPPVLIRNRRENVEKPINSA